MTPAWKQHCRPLTKLSRIVINFNRRDVDWTKYKNKQVDATIIARAVMSFACVEWHRVAYWPSIQELSGSINQMTVLEKIIAILHCFSDC